MEPYDILNLENQLCFSVYAASRAITKLYRPYLDELGITYPQYLVMLILWEKSTITLKEMGNKLFLDSGTLTPLLKRLESAKLIKRERSLEDERLLTVTITEKGLAMREKALPIPKFILTAMHVELNDLVKIKKDVDFLLEKMNI